MACERARAAAHGRGRTAADADGRATVVPTEVIKPERVEGAAAADEPLQRDEAETVVEPTPKPRPKKRQARSR